MPADWRDEALEAKWEKIRDVRRVVTGALEIERAREAHRLLARGRAAHLRRRSPICASAAEGVDLAEIAITSEAFAGGRRGRRPERLPPADVPGVAVVAGARRGPQMRALLEDPARGRLRSGLSRPVAARRRGDARIRRRPRGRRIDGEAGAARPRARRRGRRPSSVDQAHKAWMLGPFDIDEQGPRGADAVPRPRDRLEPRRQLRALHPGRRLRPLAADRLRAGRRGALRLVAVADASGSCRRCRSASIIGGAFSNVIDRFVHGAVADFFLFHVGSFEWYVFNLADVWIVAGVDRAGARLGDRAPRNRHGSVRAARQSCEFRRRSCYTPPRARRRIRRSRHDALRIDRHAGDRGARSCGGRPRRLHPDRHLRHRRKPRDGDVPRSDRAALGKREKEPIEYQPRAPLVMPPRPPAQLPPPARDGVRRRDADLAGRSDTDAGARRAGVTTIRSTT